jgi:hypothetical protein
MKRDPETRLIDASELRGRLAELLCDGPTTLYRRPARAAVAQSCESAMPSPSAARPQEPELLTQRNLTPLPRPPVSFPVDAPTGASVVVSRPRRRALLRHLMWGAGAVVAVASLACSLLGRAAPGSAQLRAGMPSKPAAVVADTSRDGVPQGARTAAEPVERAAPTPPPCARDALVALVEGRKRDAIVAYRMLGAVEPYPAVVRILEGELQRESERRNP